MAIIQKGTLMKYRFFRRLLGFCTIGAFVTLLSMVLSFVSNDIFHIDVYISYIWVYVSTLILSYILNTKYVFKADFSIKGISFYFLTYLSSMGVGLVILHIYNFFLPTWDKTIITYLVLPFTTLYNFLFLSKINSHNENNN